jgi:hypothetical protein
MSAPVFAVTGSRLLTTERHADAIEQGLIWCGKLLGRGALLIHGNARGADTLARLRWERWKLQTLAYPADWDGLGVRAGFVRNTEMAEHPELCLLMAWPHPDPGERSAGTWHMVGECLARSVTVLSGWDLRPILDVPELPPAPAYSGPVPHRKALA